MKNDSNLEKPKENPELVLMNANLMLRLNQPDKGKNFLHRLDPDALPPSQQADYYFLMGRAELVLGNFAAAIDTLKHALKLHENLPTATLLQIEQVRNSLGVAYYNINANVEAIACHLKCLDVLEANHIEDKGFKIRVYYNLGNEYATVGRNDQAIQLYKEAIAEAEKDVTNPLDLGNIIVADLAGIYWGWGVLCYDQQDLDGASAKWSKSYELYKEINNLKDANSLKCLLGLILIERKDYEQAEITLKAVLEEGKRLNNYNTLFNASGNLCKLYYLTGEYQKAVEAGEQSVAYARQSHNDFWLAQALGHLADALLALGNKESALELRAEELEVAKRTSTPHLIKEVYNQYAATLEKAGKGEEALAMMKKAYEYEQKIDIRKASSY